MKFPMKEQFYTYIQNLQNQITQALEKVDGKAKFKEDRWDRPEGGGGQSRVIENGAVFEKGGVNISAVHGPLPKSMQTYFEVGEVDFFACGLSLVIHPKNPMAPTVHANHFHQQCKKACDAHHADFYNEFKIHCDRYFYNEHRDEARGVGGLFFDYLKADKSFSIEDRYDFVTEVGNVFLDAYLPIINKRKDLSYTPAHRDWQEIRRGRYVEFNLIHDKGTLFGLKTKGRIESILMSLPPHVQWKYNHEPKPGSEEAKLLDVLKNRKEWI